MRNTGGIQGKFGEQNRRNDKPISTATHDYTSGDGRLLCLCVAVLLAVTALLSCSGDLEGRP
jgi:hypothetical protein